MINRDYSQTGIVNIAGRFYYYKGHGDHKNHDDTEKQIYFELISFDGAYPKNMEISDFELYLTHCAEDESGNTVYETPYPFVLPDNASMRIDSFYYESDQTVRLTVAVSGEEGISKAFADPDTGDRDVIPVLVIKNPDGTSAGLIAGGHLRNCNENSNKTSKWFSYFAVLPKQDS